MKKKLKENLPFSGFLAWHTALLMKDCLMWSNYSFNNKEAYVQAIQPSLHDSLVELIFSIGPCMIWILDTYTGQYEFVSSNVRLLLGYAPEKFTQGGISFTHSLIHPRDLSKLEQTSTSMHRSTSVESNLPDNYMPSMHEFRMKKANGNYTTLLEQSIALKTNSKGVVTHVLSMSFDISQPLAEVKESTTEFFVDRQTTALSHWVASDQYPYTKLSKREIEVAMLVAKGYSSKQIAEMLFISMHTVNTHRKKINSKRVNNSAACYE